MTHEIDGAEYRLKHVEMALGRLEMAVLRAERNHVFASDDILLLKNRIEEMDKRLITIHEIINGLACVKDEPCP